MARNADLFNEAGFAEDYIKHRPSYTTNVTNNIIDFLLEKKPGPHSLAVDVGCGSGQSAVQFAQHFEHVIGCDTSTEQLNKASKNNTYPNIEYRLGKAEELPVPDESVDLISASNAAHWFGDIDGFYREVNRVLKPNGCLAIYGNTNVFVCSDNKSDELQALLDKFYYVTLKDFWPEKSILLRKDYYGFYQPPFPEVKRHDWLPVHMRGTVADVIGYLRSMTACHNYIKANSKSNILQDLEDRIMHVLDVNSTPEKTPLHCFFRIYLITARKT